MRPPNKTHSLEPDGVCFRNLDLEYATLGQVLGDEMESAKALTAGANLRDWLKPEDRNPQFEILMPSVLGLPAGFGMRVSVFSADWRRFGRSLVRAKAR